MIKINQIKTVAGTIEDLKLESPDEVAIDGTNLRLLPGLIDPHVHFRIPGQAYKEDWTTAARASICGGYTTVFDMPNNVPACISHERLLAKKALIDEQLRTANIPLNYQLYLGADKHHFDQISQVKNDVIGIKIFMGSSTGDLLMDDDSSLHAAFALGAAHDLVVAVHAEEECMITTRQAQFQDKLTHAIHSKIRSPDVAASAVTKAISLAQMYGTRLYILHVSSRDEIELIKKAKQVGIKVYAEACPHHLFLNDSAYEKLAGRAQMNPPLRSEDHRLHLWQAIKDGVIDTIGSDHAPHTIAEKEQPYPQSPSGVPGIETTLPLLLNAHQQGLLTLADIVKLTHDNIEKLFHFTTPKDYVLVDLNCEQTVDAANLSSKCGWSPYAGMTLKGWPVYTIIDDRLYDLEALREQPATAQPTTFS